MSLQIVEYNVHERNFRRITYLSGLLFISVVITQNSKYVYVFICLCFLTLIVYVIYDNTFKRYNILGLCSIGLHSVRIELANRLEYVNFSEILFIYGGYKGKNSGLFIKFFSGSNVKSGATNYLILKNDTTTKIQIMLNSKKEYKDLLSKLAEIEASGIKVQKERYLFFAVKNILKKLRLLK